MDIDSIPQNEGSGQEIHCGKSHNFHEKENRAPRTKWCKKHETEDRCWAFGAFDGTTFDSARALSVHFESGHAAAAAQFKDNWRKQENFQRSNAIFVDIDNKIYIDEHGQPIKRRGIDPETGKERTYNYIECPMSDEEAAELLQHPLIVAHCAIAQESTSSQPGDRRFHAFFITDRDITSAEHHRSLTRRLQSQFRRADPACKDAARFFYGSLNPCAIVQERTIPLAMIEAIPDPRQRRTPARSAAAPISSSEQQQRVEDALSRIPANGICYNDWFTLIAAVASEFDVSTAESILERWSGYCSKPGEIRKKLDSLGSVDDPATIATVFYFAIQYGWTPPIERAYDESPIDLDRAPADTPQDWFTDLPDSWRVLIMNALKPSHALVIELFFQAVKAGCVKAQNFSARDLMAANELLGFNIPQATLYQALKELSGEFFPFFHIKITRPEEAPDDLRGELFQNFPINDVQETIVGNFWKNSTRGRKVIYYGLNPYADVKAALIEYANPRIYERASQSYEGEILMPPTAGMVQAAGVGEGEAAAVAGELHQALSAAYEAQGHKERPAVKHAKRRRTRLIADLDDPHSTPLPEGWPLDNAAHYRDAFLHVKVKAKVEANPDEKISSQELADMVGTDPRSVKARRARAGIQAESQETSVEVQSFDDIRAYGKANRAYAKCVVARTKGGETEAPAKGESYAAFISRQRATGARVTAHFQHTSTYKIVSEAPPERASRKPKEHLSGLESRSAPRSMSEKSERYYGPGYDPRWILAQLQLALKLLGWIYDNGRLIHPDTGEIAPDTPMEIIEVLIGREIGESWDVFRELGAELGAVMSITEARQIRPAGDGWQEVPLRKVG